MSEKLEATILVYSRFVTGSRQEKPSEPRIGLVDLGNNESSWTYRSPNVPVNAPLYDWGFIRVGKAGFADGKKRKRKCRGKRLAM